MKYTLTILLATLLAVAGAASAQTNPAVTNPGTTPSAGKNSQPGKQAGAANPADEVERKVEDAVTNKLKSVGTKAL